VGSVGTLEGRATTRRDLDGQEEQEDENLKFSKDKWKSYP